MAWTRCFPQQQRPDGDQPGRDLKSPSLSTPAVHGQCASDGSTMAVLPPCNAFFPSRPTTSMGERAKEGVSMQLAVVPCIRALRKAPCLMIARRPHSNGMLIHQRPVLGTITCAEAAGELGASGQARAVPGHSGGLESPLSAPCFWWSVLT